ncbi:MAG: cytochrome c3 family protein [Desulfobacterales bacterium]|nr:cytochrome c3 family protein [Desulfobacterales bacterium]
MKYFCWCFSILLLFCSALPVFSQDDVIVMNNEELGVHQRPLVSFPHEQHTKDIDCSRCHHDYDIFGVNTDAEGRKCSECHTRESAASNIAPLAKAVHLQCKGCHFKMKKQGKKEVPLMCGQCHIRKAEKP